MIKKYICGEKIKTLFDNLKKTAVMINKNNAIVTLFCLMLISFFACHNNDDPSSFIFGRYKLFSNDPSLQQFTSGENTFIEIGKDETIIYNSTINNKPKFNFSGTYKFNKKTNTLAIEWKDGKLPAVLKVETVNDGYVIRIGDTQYKKEKK